MKNRKSNQIKSKITNETTEEELDEAEMNALFDRELDEAAIKMKVDEEKSHRELDEAVMGALLDKGVLVGEDPRGVTVVEVGFPYKSKATH